MNEDPTPDPAEWLDGPPPFELEAISRHLAQCPLCQVALRSWHRIAGLPPELLLDGPPQDADRLVHGALHRLRQEPPGTAAEPGIPRQYGPGRRPR